MQKDLCSISQGTSDIASYFTRFKRFWDELNDITLLPSCSCGASQAIDKHEQDQRLMQFLMGLNADYKTIRGNLLMLTPLPSIAQAYSIQLQEEKQREVVASTDFAQDSASFHVSGNRNSFPKGTYGSGQFNRPSNNRFDRNERGMKNENVEVSCRYCKKPGHTIDQCYKLQNKGKRVAGCANSEEILQSDDKCAGVIPGFSQDQCNQLLAFLSLSQTPNGADNSVDSTSGMLPSSANFAGIISCFSYGLAGSCTCFSCIHSSHKPWILDTGASDHMCFYSSLFSSLHDLHHPFVITLPNNQTISVSQVGTDPLLSNVTLQNVLFVPTFKFNPLSIQKLTMQYNCSIQFTISHCLMQGPSMKRPLVLGEAKGGLYLLHSYPTTQPKVKKL